jgi:hypothetical protein
VVSFAIRAEDYIKPKLVKAFLGIKLVDVFDDNDTDIAGVPDAFVSYNYKLENFNVGTFHT